ncbi:MAG: L-2-hydroxyglutarate oxidase LhgO [Pelotomaculum sp. PtaB.Bin013]|nr:MAG: L-2-hydroxyglutarate oxidase LhgO [Pelotomaculum sp. PtaB.Bin013]
MIGAAIAAKVAQESRQVYVIEKNESFGMETSSRNSQVIHAGLYYPENSLKAKTCVEGNKLLYDLCRRFAIGHRNTGKIIVAVDSFECDALEDLLNKGRKNGVEDLRLLSRRELQSLEPNIAGVAALLSPSTGILNVHELIKMFLNQAKELGAQVVYKSEVTGVEKDNALYQIEVDSSGEKFLFETRVVINSAGLHADEVARMAGIDIAGAGYTLYYCKGEYYSVSWGKSRLIDRLVYPVPPAKLTGVGVHVTLDLDGRIRLGPSAQYIDEIDYHIDDSNKRQFYAEAKKLLPFLDYDDIEPEMVGIRPKLQKPGEGQKDFIIRHETDRGLPGLINLIGIESPGITASPAIADIVSDMVKQIL